MGTYDRPSKTQRSGIVVTVADLGNPVTGASISIYKAPEGQERGKFAAKNWKAENQRYVTTQQTRDRDNQSVTTFHLEPGTYVVQYENEPDTPAQCVEVQPGCYVNVCFDLPLGFAIEPKYVDDNCEDIKCGVPQVGHRAIFTPKFTKLSSPAPSLTVIPPAEAIASPDQQSYLVPVTAAGANSTSWTVLLPTRNPIPNGAPPPAPANLRVNSSFLAAPPTAQTIAGNLGVALQRTATALTADVAHWRAILNHTEVLSFNHYLRFMEMVFCNERDLSGLPPFEQTRFLQKEALGRGLLTRRLLPFIDTDAYRLLKVATEAFVMVNCGIMASPRPFFDSRDSGYFARRDVPFPTNGLDSLFTTDYLTQVTGGGAGALTLPYLAVIRRKLGDIDINIGPFQFSADQSSECYGILQEKLTNPCLLELIWSYWHEEG